MLIPRRNRPHRIGTLAYPVPPYLEHPADRSYVHTASNGVMTTIYVSGEDRWHYIDGTTRRMMLPHVPTDIAGRYALTFYDLSTRRGYRRFHDDYMLEDKHEPWDQWSVKKTFPYRAQFRISGTVNPTHNL